MAQISACMMGKLGIGKSTIIKNVLGESAKELPEVSRARKGGCTKGVKKYTGGRNGRQYDLYDSEGTFGMLDNFPELVNKLADGLKGEQVHVMCCCINAAGLTRLDEETLKSILMCAGILGRVGAKNLLIVFTRCDTQDAKESAVEVFESLREVSEEKELIDMLEGKETHVAPGVRPLMQLIREDMLGFAMVEKNNVDALVTAMDAFSKARERATVTPTRWVRCQKIWKELRNTVGAIVGIASKAGPVCAIAANAAGYQRLSEFIELIKALEEAAPAVMEGAKYFFPPRDIAESMECKFATPPKRSREESQDPDNNARMAKKPRVTQ